MDILQRFKHIKTDLSYIGLIRNEEYGRYLCTPENSIVFAGLGVDGIHFCFIPEGNNEQQDGLVYVVNPSVSEHYVEPVAKDLRTFFSLVYSIKDAGALECISYMSEEQFRQYIADIPVEDDDIVNAAAILKDELDLFELSNVYEYVKKIQSNFNYSVIKYSQEFYDA